MRVLLSWLVSLFRCPGCAELRSERDYLRGILSSTRSMTRDATPVVPIATIKGLVDDSGNLPAAIHTEEEQPKQPLWFGREAVQDLTLADN